MLVAGGAPAGRNVARGLPRGYLLYVGARKRAKNLETLFAALASCAYYLAYALIVWRTVQGTFSIGDLTFLAGSFRRLRQLLEGGQRGVVGRDGLDGVDRQRDHIRLREAHRRLVDDRSGRPA